jgi:hypothetical protein
MVFKFDAPKLLVSGVRLLMDFKKKNQKEFTSINILNRVVKISNSNAVSWVDIPLCEIEILKAAKSGLEMEIISSNPQNNPIILNQFSFYGISKLDFNFVPKVKSLEEQIQTEEDKKSKGGKEDLAQS